jgi:hypothetical protein
MAETTVRRVRRARTRRVGLSLSSEFENAGEIERKNAAAALQRALDRRDNGGVWGHGS